jgi:hypothetical protein
MLIQGLYGKAQESSGIVWPDRPPFYCTPAQRKFCVLRPFLHGRKAVRGAWSFTIGEILGVSRSRGLDERFALRTEDLDEMIGVF